MSSNASDKVRDHSTMATFCILIFSHFDWLWNIFRSSAISYKSPLYYLSLHMKLFTSSLRPFWYFSCEFYVPRVSIAIAFDFRVWKPSCFGRNNLMSCHAVNWYWFLASLWSFCLVDTKKNNFENITVSGYVHTVQDEPVSTDWKFVRLSVAFT